MAVTVNTSGTDSTLLKDWYGPMQQNDEALAQQANLNETAINNEAAARQTAIQNEAAARQAADNNITKTGGTIDTKISAFNTNTVQPISAIATQNETAINNITKTNGIIDTKISVFNTATVQPIATRVTTAEGEITDLNDDVRALNGARIWQGTSAEAASATARTATISGFPSAYAAGQLVMMTFDGDIKGTQDPVSGEDGAAVTLNINNLGAKPIYFEYNDAGTFAPDTTIVYRDTPVLLAYDGYHWLAVMMGYAREAFYARIAKGPLAKQIVYSGICTTAATTAAKTVTIAGFPTTLSNELTVRVRFTNGITSGDSTTLNINGTGAKGVKVCSSIDGLSYFTGIGEGAEVVLAYNSAEDVWVIAGSGLAWYAYTAGELYEDGAQANILLPSFYNWAASVTTDTFTTITEDIDTAYGTMASIDFSAAAITPNAGGRRMISLSFVSGSPATVFTEPTELIAPSGWYFVGDDCEDGDFVPAANMRYDVLIEYRNGVVRGYVSGYEVTA